MPLAEQPHCVTAHARGNRLPTASGRRQMQGQKTKTERTWNACQARMLCLPAVCTAAGRLWLADSRRGCKDC